MQEGNSKMNRFQIRIKSEEMSSQNTQTVILRRNKTIHPVGTPPHTQHTSVVARNGQRGPTTSRHSPLTHDMTGLAHKIHIM